MKVEELRIGNLVNDRGGKALEIHYWERAGMVAMNQMVDGITVHPLTEMCEHLQPIPLTEEILLECGFENYDSLKFSIDDTLIVDLQDFTFGVNPYDTFWFSECGIIYVHQLQNLYFALTGKELEFKTLGK